MAKILVIEDETPLRDYIIEILEGADFETIAAPDGQVGTELAIEHLPDLIICDILMPERNGHEVLSILRDTPATALIPFIFLTARGTAADFRQGMNLGADDYLVKPCTLNELMDAVTSRLQRQSAVTQLHQKVTELEQSQVLMDEFLETASQEIRKSISNISVAVKLLHKTPDRDKQQRYLELLQTESFRETRLMDDLLELHRLKTNLRTSRPEELTLKQWLPVAIESCQVQARKRLQTIQLVIPPYLPVLMTDHADLKRIVTELLTNACKFTVPNGKIVLEVQRTTLGVGINPPTVLVISNEAEIPTASLTQVFDEFYRVPGGDPYRQGGNGLGLAIVKRLAERQDGSIQVSSQNGWTQFMVQLPMGLVEEPNKAPSP